MAANTFQTRAGDMVNGSEAANADESVSSRRRPRSVGQRILSFWNDELGLTVSAIVLIGILVVATVAFGAIAAAKITEAGNTITSVTFGG